MCIRDSLRILRVNNTHHLILITSYAAMLLNRFRCIRSGFAVRILRHFRKIIPNGTDKRFCRCLLYTSGKRNAEFRLRPAVCNRRNDLRKLFAVKVKGKF